MKYEISKLLELITNFAYEENTEAERAREVTFIIAPQPRVFSRQSKRKYDAIRISNDVIDI